MPRNPIIGLTALASGLLVCACAGTDPEPIAPAPIPAREAAPASEPVDAPETPETTGESSRDSASEVEAAIESALDEGWQDLRIVSECITEAGPEAVGVFGNGVAVWGKKTQFALTRDQIRLQLEALQEADFAHLAAVYGGRKAVPPEEIQDPRLRPPDAGTSSMHQPARIICRVALELDGVSWQAAQLRRGEQSAALRRLAERILDICREPARAGLTPTDLDDALAKAAAGELDPETLSVLLHHKPGTGEDAGGFLLRLEGRKASSRTFRPGEGYGDLHLLELHPDDVAILFQLLAEQGTSELPINLYAEHYTDVAIELLGHRQTVQARQFADMTPAQHGEKQERFERIYGGLYELHERVMAEGRPEARQ